MRYRWESSRKLTNDISELLLNIDEYAYVKKEWRTLLRSNQLAQATIKQILNCLLNLALQEKNLKEFLKRNWELRKFLLAEDGGVLSRNLLD